MPSEAIAILLVSAALHTTWNLLLKGSSNKTVASWWAMLIGSLLFLPALLIAGLPARSTWVLIAISGFVEAAYFIILAYAYEDADFSLVYPLARGGAPALIAIWSVLFLREELTAGGVAGLIAIIVGLLIVGMSGSFKADGKLHWRGIMPALGVAVCISIYTVIDGAAVKMTSPVAYAALVYLVSSLYMTPYVVLRHGAPGLRREWQAQGWRLLGIGLLIQVGYFLALLAYRLSHVSYAGAIREVSVVMGALAGWQFLGEEFGARRVVGATIIFAGILAIALLG